MSDGATIAAIATGPSHAGVGVLRVSGPRVPAIARQLLGRDPQPRHAHLVSLTEADGTLIDQGLLLHFPAPRSFTGEHVLELQTHGSPVVLELLLQRLVGLGARRARPGEFSERAFLNGKLDLAQAEAIADLIAAGSAAQARAAVRSLQGAFSAQVNRTVEALIQLRVHVEAAIDFPEEEIDFLADPVIAERLRAVTASLEALRAESARGARLNRGLHALILGPPNAGKSSLLNQLSGTERAIVTEQAGTTRDLLREEIAIDGVALTLIDTAGLRVESNDPIEREGMRRARDLRAHSDLFLLVVPDGNAEAQAALAEEVPDDGVCFWVHNKIDLTQGSAGLRRQEGRHTHFGICARTGEGLDALRQALREHAQGGGEAVAFSARERHVEAMDRARLSLESAATQLKDGAGELLAEELRAAQHALGEITGAVDADALLGRIFAEFCIGK